MHKSPNVARAAPHGPDRAGPSAAASKHSAECTCFLLRRLSRRVSQLYDQHLAHAGLRTTQYSLLSFIRRDGRIVMSELAAALGMDRSTLSRNIRPLIDAGYVEQHMVSKTPRAASGEPASHPDPRAKVVSLTPAGLEQWRLARAQWKKAQLAMRDSLGDPHLQALHDTIDQTLVRLPEEIPA